MATLREDVKRLVASIALSQDTSLNWTAANPVVPSGVLCLETDTGKIKLGDGSTAWNDLGYKIEAVLTAAQKTLLDNAGAANGVVVAGTDGKIALDQIPVLTEDKLPLALKNGAVHFVADIAAMEALEDKGGLIYVLDASAWEDIESGAGQFIWNEEQSKWIKIGETESLDLDLTNYFDYVNMDADDITEGETHLFLTTAEREAIAKATSDIATLAQTVVDNKVVTDATQTELTNYKASNDAALSTLSGTVIANKSAADQTQADLDVLEADVAAYKASNNEAVAANAAAAAKAQGDVDTLSGQFTAYKGTNDAAVAANAAAASAAQAAADKAQGDIDAHKGVYATDKAALEKSIEDLAGLLDDLTGDTGTNLSEITGRLDALDGAAGRVATLEGKVAANEGAITALQTRAGEIEGAATALAGRVTTAEGKITTLEGEMDAVEGRAEALEGRATTVEGKVTTLEGEMDAAEGRLDALESTAADAVLYSHEDDLIIGGMNAATMKALYTA